jgi:hypothetical protein
MVGNPVVRSPDRTRLLGRLPRVERDNPRRLVLTGYRHTGGVIVAAQEVGEVVVRLCVNNIMWGSSAQHEQQ